MRKYGFASIVLLISILGCKVQYSNWRDYNQKTSNFVQSADIKAGEKLKKEHKDDEFIFNNYILEVDFTKNPDFEEWQKKKNEKKKKITKLKWVKDRRNYSVQVDDEFTDSEVKKIKEEYEKRFLENYGHVDEDDFQSYLEEVKRDRNSTPPGQYMSLEKHSYELTSLEDFNYYPLYIPYSGAEQIKDLSVDYGRGTFEPTHIVTPYESNGIFYNDLNIYGASMYFPTLGSRAYVDYSVEYTDMKYETTVYVPEDYFQERKVVSFAIPSWLDVTIVEKNFDGVEFTKTNAAPKAIKKKVVKNKNDDGSVSTVADDGETETGSKKTTGKIKPKEKKPKPTGNVKYITYEFKNVKPMDRKLDHNSRGPSYTYPHFLIQYNSVTEGTEQKPMTGSVRGLYNWCHELVTQLKNDTAALGKMTRQLTENKTTDDEKIKSIYYWVQDNIRYVAFEDGIAGFKPEECNNVYNNRYGDCKGMANLLVNMLRVAGYDARRVWIGTRHLNYDYSTPSLAINNHMIAALKNDTGFIFLDGTETFCPLNQYAYRIQGRQVMIEDGDSFILKNIPEYGPEYNLTSMNSTITIDGKKLKTSTEKTYHGESRLDFIRSLNEMEMQDRDKALYNYVSERNISLKPSNIKTSDIEDREGDASISYNLEIENHIIEAGEQKYVSMDWERDLDEMEFDSAKHSDFDFEQKLCIKSETKMDVSGYTVNHIPDGIMEDNEFYRVILNIRKDKNALIYKKEIIMKQGYLPANELSKWNELNKKINAFYNDYVILK